MIDASKCHELRKRQMLINCRTVNTTKTTASDSDESESDGGAGDEELLLAMQMSMAPTSPKIVYNVRNGVGPCMYRNMCVFLCTFSRLC